MGMNNPRHSQNPNRARAGAAQSLSAFAACRARRHHIVNDKNAPPFDALLVMGIDNESARDIALSVAAFQTRLLLGVAGADQEVGEMRDLADLGKSAGDFGGLVEASLEEAAAVEGDGGEQVGFVEDVAAGARDPLGGGDGDFGVVAEFHLGDEDSAFFGSVEHGGAGVIVGRFDEAALGALHMGGPGVGEGDACDGASGFVNEADRFPAWRAEASVGEDGCVADEAMRGEDPVSGCLEDLGEGHGLL